MAMDKLRPLMAKTRLFIRTIIQPRDRSDKKQILKIQDDTSYSTCCQVPSLALCCDIPTVEITVSKCALFPGLSTSLVYVVFNAPLANSHLARAQRELLFI
ncbi:hypothetical protein Bbelb_089430 [Branchiostoma belcheri]|nr:hypothetical protein Bbelb_089430 [Branchiostoma belcheri]